MAVTGIVLAAGAGTRAGGPKALRPGWLAHACAVLLEGGCDRVVVVLGAAGDAPIPADARVTSVIAADWAEGLSHSLKRGLAESDGDAALITLVDLPGLPVSVVRRVLAASGELRQAVFEGRPGHPAYISGSHRESLEATGDHGARSYLLAHGVTEIECGDLWDGRDVDAD
jgi:CTP:molybdopterin cytidylyltransferase MocA